MTSMIDMRYSIKSNQVVINYIGNINCICIESPVIINSGSYIIKNNEETRNFLDEVIHLTGTNNTYYNSWPFDQYYMSKHVYTNCSKFYIFKCTVTNTPFGEIIRHNWFKNDKLKNDMLAVIQDQSTSNEKVNLEDLLSTAPYINTGVFLV